MSNVRPLMVRGASVSVSGSPREANLTRVSAGRPSVGGRLTVGGARMNDRRGWSGLSVLRRPAHGLLCASEATLSLLGAPSAFAKRRRLPGGAGGGVHRLGVVARVVEVGLGQSVWPREFASTKVHGRCLATVRARGEQNAGSGAGQVHAQVVALFTRPNPSLERTSKGVPPLAAAQLQR